MSTILHSDVVGESQAQSRRYLGGTRLASGIAVTLFAASHSSIAYAQAASAPASAPATVSDQSEPAGGLAEIIVTAEKRSTNLQKTPISITALDGQELQRAQVRTLVDVQSLVPGVKIGDNNGYAQITVRGVGISGFHPASDSAVAVNVNEVYIARPIAQLTSMFDVGSLEVLRGPQGTLYGRNATAGAVNITTTRPTNDWSGYVRGSYGNFSAVNLEAAVGGALVEDKLLIRVAAFVDRNDGRATNLVTGTGVDDRNARGIRGTLVFKPSETVTATLIAEHYFERDHANARHYFGADKDIGGVGTLSVTTTSQMKGGYVPADLRDIAAGIDPQFRLDTTGVTGILEWSQGAFSVKSITGYRKTKSDQMTALDGGSVLVMFNHTGEDAKQFSEELQLHYDTSGLHVTGGLYYFHEDDLAAPGAVYASSDVVFRPPVPVPSYFGNVLTQAGSLKTKAYAVFGQATYDVTDKLSLTAGLRYSKEAKSLVSQYLLDLSLSKPYVYNPANPFYDPAPLPTATRPQPDQTYNSTTPKFGIQYQASPRVMLYATFAKGFKSGNFETIDPSPAYNPEKLTDFEGGIKFTTSDNRLRVNMSAFYYDYKDLQVQQVVNVTLITNNAGNSHVYGGELESVFAPTDDFTIGLNLTYLHARYTDYLGPDGARPLNTIPGTRTPINVSFNGNRLNNAPDFTAHLSMEKSWKVSSGKFAVRAEGDYSSKFYFTPGNYDLLSQGAFAKANAFVSYTDDRGWAITGFVRNLADKITKTSGNVNAALNGAAIEGSIAPPRTYGIELAYKF
jgi:iron complex outermembrane receptor protein